MTKLKRAISLPLLTCYGVGTILGAGIYVLVGKVAVSAGMYTPLSFILAAVIATFTGISYAELSSRLPKSAGEALYVHTVWERRWLSIVVGWMIIFTGVVSAATLANGFVGYFHLFFDIERWLVITCLVSAMGFFAIWGISESVAIITIGTLIEVGGLLFVFFSGREGLLSLPDRMGELTPPLSGEIFIGISLGAFLAFYAYIGFEDMVNIAEEVKDVQKTLPKGIFLAIGISTVLYILTALVAVLSVPLEELKESEAPLALVVSQKGKYAATFIGFVSLFAVVNSALVQIIMASRVAYGMAVHGLTYYRFAHVHARTRTPIVATLLMTLIVLALALGFPLVTLAKMTSFVILLVFALVNVSLFVLKRRHPKPVNIRTYPSWIPIIGCGLCLGLLAIQFSQLLGY